MIAKKAAATVTIDNLNNLESIEVWDTVWGGKSTRKLGTLVPMHAEHFAERKASGAFTPGATGRPFYYTRTETGIEVHPACDKDYWLEPTFRSF